MLRMTLSETPRDEHSLKFRRMEGQTEDIHPLGTNSPPRGKLYLWGSKFVPRDEIKNRPLP
jgi:hypothetical protein